MIKKRVLSAWDKTQKVLSLYILRWHYPDQVRFILVSRMSQPSTLSSQDFIDM